MLRPYGVPDYESGFTKSDLVSGNNLIDEQHQEP